MSTHLGSQLRLTVILGFGIPYILYQKLLCLLLLCNSPTLSGISTFSQKVSVVFLGSQLRLLVVLGIGIPYILYQKLLCLLLVDTSPTLSDISNLSQEGI